MAFASVWFVLFFSLAALLWYTVPARFRSFVLLAASLAFYATYSVYHCAVLIFVIAVSYIFGRLMDGAAGIKSRTALLSVSVALLLACLVLLKYARYFEMLPGASSGFAGIVAPVGLSFYTLTATGYLIDVKRGAQAEKNPVDLALFISFFPSLLSGPIPRSSSLIPQLKSCPRFDFENISHGFLKVVVGMFVKFVIADNIAVITSGRYAEGVPANMMLLSTVVYGIQIYADFMSYSLLASGFARMLGIELMQNFRQPYLSRSVKEFWRRWHISLSSWFRDYLYIPLGGSRAGKLKTVANTLVVFAVSGLWHGEGLNFLIWGLLHGFYLTIEGLISPFTDKLKTRLSIKNNGLVNRIAAPVFTFLLVDFAWIFFASSSVGNAFFVISRIFSSSAWHFEPGFLLSFGLEPVKMIAAAVGIALLFVYDVIDNRRGFDNLFFARLGTVPRFAAYYLLLVLIMLFGQSGASTFLYFNF